MHVCVQVSMCTLHGLIPLFLKIVQLAQVAPGPGLETGEHLAFHNIQRSNFIKNCHSYYSTCQVFKILYSSFNVIPECVLCLDAEKPFDQVEWRYLFANLQKNQLQPKFYHMYGLSCCIFLLPAFLPHRSLVNSFRLQRET